MSNKKETPVSWLVKEISRDRVGRAIITTFLKEFEQAKELESQKQQKYDEMLAMLEKHLIFHNAEMEGLQQPSSEMWFELYKKTEQLIKEAKEL
jgi:hypothetical protein